MALNIKDDEAHALARRLAAATGESLTEAVTTAVRERLERVQQRSGGSTGRAERLRAIGRETAPLLAAVPAVDDLLYDERGLPDVIVDSSALVAILRDEPDADTFAHALDGDRTARISAANYLEAAIVADAARDPVVSRRFDELIRIAELVVEPVTIEQVLIARAAYRDFGRGSGHAAKLNFGDCFAYALALDTGEPLLFKGDDFGHTGVPSARDDVSY